MQEHLGKSPYDPAGNRTETDAFPGDSKQPDQGMYGAGLRGTGEWEGLFSHGTGNGVFEHLPGGRGCGAGRRFRVPVCAADLRDAERAFGGIRGTDGGAADPAAPGGGHPGHHRGGGIFKGKV